MVVRSCGDSLDAWNARRWRAHLCSMVLWNVLVSTVSMFSRCVHWLCTHLIMTRKVLTTTTDRTYAASTVIPPGTMNSRTRNMNGSMTSRVSLVWTSCGQCLKNCPV